MKKSNPLRNPVFVTSASLLIAIVLIGAIAPKSFGKVAEILFEYTTTYFGWLYLLAVFSFVIFLVSISLMKFGKIRLGPDDSRPTYPFFSWIAMLFSAGFGSGLVFWGVAEPMSHFFETPFADLSGQTTEAARVAMQYSFFHWGISQWSTFGLVGLVIAYMQFRRGRNGLISTAIRPVIGKYRATRGIIDTLAVIATVMGVATSLGLGILQMNGGLQYVFGAPDVIWIQLLIAVTVLIMYLLSSTTGLDKGIKWLSTLNLSFCLLLFLFVFIFGPTGWILDSFVLGLGDYLTDFIKYSLRLNPYSDSTWIQEWTIFYWAWAIAWSPFVGAFIARVSRGRTIREFVFGVLVVPPTIAIVWISAFGGTGLASDLYKGTKIAEVVNQDLSFAIFELFQTLPFGNFMSILAILLIFTFLVTSADSATYILASMTSRGSLNPTTGVKIFWGILVSAIAVVLLFAGGLEALQTAALSAALPFVIVLIIMMISLIKLLKNDKYI